MHSGPAPDPMQEIEVRISLLLESITTGAAQLVPLNTKAWLAKSIATQKVLLAHETPMTGTESKLVGFDHIPD